MRHATLREIIWDCGALARCCPSQYRLSASGSYGSAIALAGTAAWFSIRGMVVLFPGAPMSVVAMAIAMEGSKLYSDWIEARTPSFVASVVFYLNMELPDLLIDDLFAATDDKDEGEVAS